MEHTSTAKPSRFERFLKGTENLGNKIPHPMMLFIWLSIAVILLSFICSMFGVSDVNPATGEIVTAYNLLSVDGLVKMITQAVNNFITLPALGMVLVCMMGVGLCDHSGLFYTALKGFADFSKGSDTVVIAAFSFVSIMAGCAGGAGFVVMPALGAMIWMGMKKNPLAGMFVAYSSVSGGYASSLIITAWDVVNASFTTAAAQLIDPNISLSPAINWYFSAVSVPILTIASVVLTLKVLEPRMEKYDPAFSDLEAEDTISLTSAKEKKALKMAGLSVLAYAAVVVVLVVTGVLCDPKTGSPIATNAPLMKGITIFIALMFAVPGTVYGVVSGKFQGISDIAKALEKTMAGMGGYIALMFFIAQFLNYFNWSNLGIILAIKGANLLKVSEFPIWMVLILFMLMCMLLNLFIGSASTKWAILASVFVPMFMVLGFHPGLIQMAYRIGDAVTNPICAIDAYFVMLLALAQRYDRRCGVGTLLANMMPFALTYGALMMIQLLLWYFLNLPMGPNAPILLS